MQKIPGAWVLKLCFVLQPPACGRAPSPPLGSTLPLGIGIYTSSHLPPGEVGRRSGRVGHLVTTIGIVVTQKLAQLSRPM